MYSLFRDSNDYLYDIDQREGKGWANILEVFTSKNFAVIAMGYLILRSVASRRDSNQNDLRQFLGTRVQRETRLGGVKEAQVWRLSHDLPFMEGSRR